MPDRQSPRHHRKSAARETGVRVNPLAAERKREANEFAESLAGIVAEIRAEGITTFRGITSELNRRQIPQPQAGFGTSQQYFGWYSGSRPRPNLKWSSTLCILTHHKRRN